MTIDFWKMHGAGNDFILVDDREERFPATQKAWMESIAARRTGVGSDGIILIQKSKSSNFRMRFFNPDGGEAEMCGNGARCVARLAHEIGAAPASMTIETAAGALRAEAMGDSVRLFMTEPVNWRLQQTVDVAGKALRYCSVNTGVPHVVVQATGLAQVNVHDTGRAIRTHSAFAPAGTNANFFEQTGPRALRVRTYERGVEAETLACGTGIVATGLIAGKLGLVKAPVLITCASGDVLEVSYELTETGAKNVTLLGPAAHVFRGTLQYA